jgi:hypothetical protein
MEWDKWMGWEIAADYADERRAAEPQAQKTSTTEARRRGENQTQKLKAKSQNLNPEDTEKILEDAES